MKRVRIFLVVIVLAISITNVQAQEISMSDFVGKTWEVVSCQQLKNTSWHLKEPNNPNVDTYFEFSDRILTNVSDVHYADTKFRKGLKKKYINKYLFYIANQIPSSFDSKKVGQSEKGIYIIQELDGEFFWFQILQFSSSELKVKTKLGQTFVFEKV